MKSILKYIEELFKPITHQNNLEEYIVANNPQSVNDVEKLTREYDRKMSQTLATFDRKSDWPQ